MKFYTYQPRIIVSTGIIFLIVLMFKTHSIYAKKFWQQTESDSYTRYELLDPTSQSFRIIYDVSATSEGANYYFNTLRKGSEHKVDAVIDRMSGKQLEWKIVHGAEARENGLSDADEGTDYLQIALARPVPKGGEVRLRIDKTYKDANSYYSKDGRIVFDRSLGIKRNSVVLPAGFELVFSNYPVQVDKIEDGRIKVSFINVGSQAVNFTIEGRRMLGNKQTTLSQAKNPWPDYQPVPEGRDKSHVRLNYNLNERAYQDREIVYFLHQPETHTFSLFHDYTEMREGVDKYINIVRAGSKASNPSAKILDTGKNLKVETLRGKELAEKGIDPGEEGGEDTEAVVIWFDPVKKGESVRLRITETYTDSNRYILFGDELIWDRSFGRPDNVVILPEGWSLTVNSIPAKIDLTEEGKIRLHYINDRPDNIDVYIKAIRR